MAIPHPVKEYTELFVGTEVQVPVLRWFHPPLHQFRQRRFYPSHASRYGYRR